MRNLLSHILKFFVYLACILALTEIGLRLFPTETKYKAIIRERLWELWSISKENERFTPPFDVYANIRWDDKQRLKKISEEVVPPKGTTWTSFDFLRPNINRELTSYKIQFNNLGFRDEKDRTANKPQNTFRIIALGTYHTFGHGVENTQTYPAQLEKELNRILKGHPKVEVWNGGRHASTMIVGLARLENEIFQYKPDLILLDYGMVDRHVIGDNLFVHNFHLPNGKLYNFLKLSVHGFTSLFGPPKILMSAMELLRARFQPTNEARFIKTLEASLDLIKKNRVPVILIQTHKAQFKQEIIKQFKNPKENIFYFSVRKYFSDHPPTIRDKEHFADNNWTTEYGGPKSFENPFFRPIEYHLNPLQYNASGQMLISKGLANLIVSSILQKNRNH